MEVSQLTSSDHTVVSSNRSGNESRPRSPPKIPGAEPSHKKNNNEESVSSEKRDKTPSSNYKGVSNSERDRKYLAHAGAGTAGAAAMALADCSTPPTRAKAVARRGRRGPDGKVVGLTGDDCADENDAAATPGGGDHGTTGGCGSDRRSGQRIELSVAELGRIVENGDEGGGGKGCKERGRVKRKEEEASSKEHDERRNNGAPPRRQRPRRSPCLRDHTDPPRSNTITMTIEPVHEIEINGIKHPCPHFEYDPNNQNVEKKCALMVDGKEMFVDFHDLTTKERGRDGSRPHPILNSSVAKKLNPPIIDDTGGDDVVQINFPNGRRNTVLFARKDSKCDILKQMYEFIDCNKSNKITMICDKNMFLLMSLSSYSLPSSP